jgi:hypothetical protein
MIDNTVEEFVGRIIIQPLLTFQQEIDTDDIDKYN